MRTILKYLIICLLIAPALLFAQSSGNGGAGFQSIFAEYGVGTSSAGMGGAFVSIADNPSAVFWNPSGLDYIDQMNFNLSYSTLTFASHYVFTGFVYPTLNLGTLGFGMARIGVNDIDLRNTFGAHQGMTTYSNNEFYISYGKRLPFNLAFGLTNKIEYQTAGEINNSLNTSGFGIDAGLMWRNRIDRSILAGWSVGFTFLNVVEPKLKLGEGTDVVGGEYRLGISKLHPLGMSNAIQIAVDYHKNKYMEPQLHFGARLKYQNFSSLMVGLSDNSPNFGASLDYKNYSLYYTFGSPNSDAAVFTATHRISFSMKLGLTRDQLFQIAEKKRVERESELVEQTREEERQKFVGVHIEKGNEFFTKENYLEAYVEFQSVLSNDPFNKEAKIMLDSSDKMIQYELEQNEARAVNAAVDKALAEENQLFIKTHYDKGRLLLDKKRFTEALMEFNLSLSRDPENQLVRSAIRTANSRLDREIRNLMNSGRAAFSEGNYGEALQILNEASILAPEDPELKRDIDNLSIRIKIQQHVQEGLIYLDLGQYDEALAAFKGALELDPANMVVQEYLGKTQSNVKTEIQKMDPESERLYLEGVELYLVGKFSEALDIWLALKEKFPYNKKVLDAITRAEDLIKRQKNK